MMRFIALNLGRWKGCGEGIKVGVEIAMQTTPSSYPCLNPLL